MELGVAGMKLDQDMEMNVEMKLQEPGARPE